MADEIQAIRSKIDIVDLVGQRVQLKKSGKNWKGLCPFHDDRNPSFDVSPSIQRYQCWSCGEKGDIFNWVMKTQNVEFAEALTILAQQAGVELSQRKGQSKTERNESAAAMAEALKFFQKSLDQSSEAISYCERRGLNQQIRTKWQIGYAPDVGEALATHLRKKGLSLALGRDLFLVDRDPSGGYFDKFRGRLMFPIRNERGDLVAFGGRVLGDGHPKYINSSDTPLYKKSRVLYGMNLAKDEIAREGRATLVEGFLDVIACHEAGVMTTLASLGTALSEEHAKLLKRWCEEVVILYDSDPAGEKAAQRAQDVLGSEGLRVKVALLPKGEDPDTLLQTEGPAAVHRIANAGVTPLEFEVRRLEGRLKHSEDAFWQQLVQILSKATNPIELDRHLVRFAALYPGTRDPLQAQRSLRNWIANVRQRASGSGSTASSSRPIEPPRAKLKIAAAEEAMFFAFMDEHFREFAYRFVREPELFSTAEARHISEALVKAFPDVAPKGPPGQWLDVIEDQDVRHQLEIIGFREPPFLTAQYLEDASRQLRKMKDERELRSLTSSVQSDEALAEIQDRLRKLKT